MGLRDAARTLQQMLKFAIMRERIYNDDIQYYICKEDMIKSVILDDRKYKCSDCVSDAMKSGNTLTRIKKDL